MKGPEGPRTRIRGNIPCKVTSGGHLGSSSHLSLLRSLLAGFRDRVSTMGQEVTLGVRDLGSRGDSL